MCLFACDWRSAHKAKERKEQLIKERTGITCYTLFSECCFVVVVVSVSTAALSEPIKRSADTLNKMMQRTMRVLCVYLFIEIGFNFPKTETCNIILLLSHFMEMTTHHLSE